MWEQRPIEQHTEKRLISELGEGSGKAVFASYVDARRQLLIEVLPHISAIEPTLTDHSATHIGNVLDNASHLLDHRIENLHCYDCYFLLMAILFHDVGNIFGRKGHANRVMEVYDHVRSAPSRDPQEKTLLASIIAAHTGSALDGSRDTLKPLNNSGGGYAGRAIRVQELAAILRFADECAEGPQRTSHLMQKLGYPANSRIYHEYARITRVHIDPRNERIALTYHIDVSRLDVLQQKSKRQVTLTQLLDFAYKRVMKLDQERKYAKHYSSLLEPFKRTTVAINFWHQDRPLNVALPELQLSDLVVPGDKEREVPDICPEYAINLVTKAVRKSSKKVGAR